MVDLESVPRERCSLRMSKVGLGSSMVSKGIGVSSCLRVSSNRPMVERFWVGVPWESCFLLLLGASLAMLMLMTRTREAGPRDAGGMSMATMGASPLSARATRSLIVQGTNLIARGARESSLRRQVNKRQDIFS